MRNTPPSASSGAGAYPGLAAALASPPTMPTTRFTRGSASKTAVMRADTAPHARPSSSAAASSTHRVDSIVGGVEAPYARPQLPSHDADWCGGCSLGESASTSVATTAAPLLPSAASPFAASPSLSLTHTSARYPVETSEGMLYAPYVRRTLGVPPTRDTKPVNGFRSASVARRMV